MSDKYRMFKNFMYNDLGITKEDIKQWTDEAVKETALKFVTNKFSEHDDVDLKNYIKILIRKEVQIILKDVVKDKFIDNLLSDIKIDINVKNDK